MTSGHVFILRGDLRYLSCDAWLMPCDVRARPLDDWFPDGYVGPRAGHRFPAYSRTQPFPDWPHELPQAWLVNVGGDESTDSRWYVDGVREFIERVASEGHPTPRNQRAKRLVALPVVGTGAGGGLAKAGEILKHLLPELRQLARVHSLDIALVAFDAPTYAAAQSERSRRADWFDGLLRNDLRTKADELATHARAGELALFLGAGVSMGAGVPGWHDLLKLLAQEAGLHNKERDAFLAVRNVLDQASILERRLARPDSGLGKAVKNVLARFDRYSLQHALLASLPVREVITTNYDQLFERAWQSNHSDELSILPSQIRRNSRRWLLKMHGCVSNPEQIVLSRASYMRYEENLPALSGIVQAFLVTRHVLFVGFSMTDDNFHRIVDAVRRIRHGTANARWLGTSICLANVGMIESLWEHDIDLVKMELEATSAPTPIAELARQAEIFLDYLAMRTRGSAHLLVGERFEEVLETSDRRIRDALCAFIATLRLDQDPTALRDSVAWPEVKRLLEELGYPTEPPAS